MNNFHELVEYYTISEVALLDGYSNSGELNSLVTGKVQYLVIEKRVVESN